MKRPSENSSSTEEEEQEKEQEEEQEKEQEKGISCGRQCVKGSMKASRLPCGFTVVAAQLMAKRKHRGIIEKQRRDRINLSLAELQCLVPGAVHKQGSAKLEKAEILQMTVDHLKGLQATVGNGPTLAPNLLCVGFRECVSEVSRYLGQVEGVETAAPWWSHLLRHLTSCIDTLAVSPLLQQQPPIIAPPLLPHQWLRPLPVWYIHSILCEARGDEVIHSTAPPPSSNCARPLLLDSSHTFFFLDPPQQRQNQ